MADGPRDPAGPGADQGEASVAAESRSVAIGGNATDSIIVTGDHNQVVEHQVRVDASAVRQRELEIRIQAPGADGACAVSALDVLENRTVLGTFEPPYTESELRIGRAWIDEGNLQSDEVRQFGSRLFAALFHGRVKELYDDSRRGDAVIQYRLYAGAPTLELVPWELLYDSDRSEFLGHDGSFVRFVSSRPGTPPQRVQAPVRLLLMDTRPKDLRRRDATITLPGIKDSVRQLVRARRLEIISIGDGRIRSLHTALDRAERRIGPYGFQILHIIGFAQRDPATGETVLIFDDGHGGQEEIAIAAFMALVQPYNLQLVIFSTGRSATSSTVQLVSGATAALKDDGPDGPAALVGLSSSGPDRAAAAAVRRLYTDIVQNRSIGFAVVRAAQEAKLTGRSQQISIGVPVCYVRGRTTQLLDVVAAEPLALTWPTLWQWARQRAKPVRMVTGLASIAVMAASVLTLYKALGPGFNPPSFDNNAGTHVAVAPFELDTATDCQVTSNTTSDVSALLVQALQGDMKGQPDTHVLALTETPAGNQSGEAAVDLATRRNADVLVYGLLGCRPGDIVLTPSIAFSGRRLQRVDAGELVGAQRFGDPILIHNDFQGDQLGEKLTQALAPRAEAMARLLHGLEDYYRGDWSTAANSFGAASSYGGAGTDIAWLFLGKTATQQSYWDDASAYYTKALEAHPGYTRAELGLAEVAYSRAISGNVSDSTQPCSASRVATDTLHNLVGIYTAFLADSSLANEPNLQLKTHYYLGRVFVCLGDAEGDFQRVHAQSEFGVVTAAYEAQTQTGLCGLPEVRALPFGCVRAAPAVPKDLAAESYAGLAFIAWQRASQDNNRDPIAHADAQTIEDDYRKATVLSSNLERQAYFQYVLANTYFRDDQPGAAIASIQQAICTAKRVVDPPLTAQVNKYESALESLHGGEPKCASA